MHQRKYPTWKRAATDVKVKRTDLWESGGRSEAVA